MFGLFFTEDAGRRVTTRPPRATRSGSRRFFHGMLERGVYLAPSAFEAGFVSSTHQDGHIQATLDAAAETFATIAS